MTRSRALSAHARKLLIELAQSETAWRHGYDLARATGLASGTLYPLLIRLEAQGHLEAQWQPSSARGRPPRHAYRLTVSGRKLAAQGATAAAEASLVPKRRREARS